MQALAGFILRGRWQAVMLLALTALLPVLNLGGGAALALVTLRKGPQEGLLTLLISTCLLLILAMGLFDSTLPVLGLMATFWLPLWVLAGVLRYTISLTVTLQSALALALLVVLGCAIALGDVTGWGRELLDRLVDPLLQQMQLTGRQRSDIAAMLAMLLPGLCVGNALLSTLLSLLLGRWWQSLLFHPGGFGAEFCALRLGQLPAWLALLLFAGVLLWQWPLLANLMLPLLVLYVLQGIAVVHGVVNRARLAQGWLVGLYVVLLLLPQTLLLLCLLGVVDAWVDVRARIPAPAGTV